MWWARLRHTCNPRWSLQCCMSLCLQFALPVFFCGVGKGRFSPGVSCGEPPHGGELGARPTTGPQPARSVQLLPPVQQVQHSVPPDDRPPHGADEQAEGSWVASSGDSRGEVLVRAAAGDVHCYTFGGTASELVSPAVPRGSIGFLIQVPSLQQKSAV